MNNFLTVNFSDIQTVSFFEINLTASLLILSIIIIRAFLKNRQPKRFFASIWIIAVLRLIVPLSVPVMLNIFPPDYYSPIDMLNGRSQATFYHPESDTYSYYGSFTPEDAAAVNNTRLSFTVISVIIGVLAFSAVLLLHLHSRRKYAEALPLKDEAITAFISSYGLKRKVLLKCSDRISAPITYGILKPVIILPKSCLEIGFERLKPVISHEMAHIRYFDILYKWVITAVTCLYWYNPFVWLMFLLSDKDIEIACDKEAVEKCGCSGSDYSELLISLEEKRCVDILARGFTAGAIKSRIKSVMRFKKTGVVSFIIAAALAFGSFTAFGSAHTGVTVYSELTPTRWARDLPENGPLLWLESGRYHLEGGTRDEYIEVYDDYTLQIFGYNYIEEMKEDYGEDYVETEDILFWDEFYKTRHKYEMSNNWFVYLYSDTVSHAIIAYEDENTLSINATGKTYIAENPSHAGIYQAEWHHKTPSYGFYKCEEDDTVIYVNENIYEKYDENGESLGVVNYTLVMCDNRPGELIMAENYKSVRDEEPIGMLFNEETETIFDPISGKTYTVSSKPLFS